MDVELSNLGYDSVHNIWSLFTDIIVGFISWIWRFSMRLSV